MILKFITVIALFKFMMLLISGSAIDTALYRSLIVFVALYTLIYMSLFLVNVIREDPQDDSASTPPGNSGKMASQPQPNKTPEGEE